MALTEVRTLLQEYADPVRARGLQRFFKTGPGEYGHGDVFLGITMPVQRKIVKEYGMSLSWDEIETLLKSELHEERSCALLSLLLQYQKGDDAKREQVYQFYCNHLEYINNWDLVDISVRDIVGHYLHARSKDVLYEWADDESLWVRRCAIVSTWYFIKHGEYEHTFEISKLLLRDKEDLIHKAVGWMMRESGKRDSTLLVAFIERYYSELPRTTLRYAIERFPESIRKRYLKGEF